jgi:predicted P-loop ATPase/GTPase
LFHHHEIKSIFNILFFKKFLIICYHINNKNIQKAIEIGICLNNDHLSLISIKRDLKILTSNPIHRPNYIGELDMHTLEIMDIDPCNLFQHIQ